MKTVSTEIITNLPELKDNTSILNPIGKILEHRENMAMIDYEINKINKQSNIITKTIDAELTKSLDKNKKDFKKEMKNIKSICKDRRDKSKNRREILSLIKKYTKILTDPNTSNKEKEMSLKSLTMLHESLNNLINQN